jgi:DNA-binding Lrp family transcriptional regulator
MQRVKLDKKDIEILRLIQENSKRSVKEIARKIHSPITTVYARIRRMEDSGIIKHYKTVLDPKKLGRGTTAFILVSFAYRSPGVEKPLDQREIAEKIAKFPEVQEVHIIAGEWDILVKVKAEDVDAIGKFVIDKLRKIEGIDKTLSCMVYETMKESLDIYLQKP